MKFNLIFENEDAFLLIKMSPFLLSLCCESDTFPIVHIMHILGKEVIFFLTNVAGEMRFLSSSTLTTETGYCLHGVESPQDPSYLNAC